MAEVTGYSVYKPEHDRRKKTNPLHELFPPLPQGPYDIIYADPPWDYHGKMQYDRSSKKDVNVGFSRPVFISAAEFNYPTVHLHTILSVWTSRPCAPMIACCSSGRPDRRWKTPSCWPRHGDFL
jgi:hypothetical protein